MALRVICVGGWGYLWDTRVTVCYEKDPGIESLGLTTCPGTEEGCHGLWCRDDGTRSLYMTALCHYCERKRLKISRHENPETIGSDGCSTNLDTVLYWTAGCQGF